MIISLYVTSPLIILLAALLTSLALRNPTSLTLSSLLSITASLIMICTSAAVLYGSNEVSAMVDLSPFLGGLISTYSLAIDPLSAIFIFVLGIIGLASSIHGIRYIEHYVGRANLMVYSLTYPLFLLSMYLTLIVRDIVMFIVSWEIMSITAFFLIAFDVSREEARRAALKYLLISYLSSLLIIIVLLTLASVSSTTSYQGIMGLKVSEVPAYIITTLLIIGFGIKAALVPMHSWLPDAHPEAPSNVSALLSGVMIKMAVYGILRFGVSLHTLDVRVLGLVLASLGTLSIFYGTSLAIIQDDSKKLMAYSSVAQIGYVFLGIGAGLLSYDTSIGIIAFAAGLLHVLNHAISKGLLFLTAGNIIYATSVRDLNMLGGLARYMPVTFVSGLIGSLSISGIPPLNCFISKWLIIMSAFLLGNPLITVYACIALFGSALTTAAFVKFVVRAFMTGGRRYEVSEAPVSMCLATMFLAVLCVVLGVYPYAPLSLILRVLTPLIKYPLTSSVYLLNELLQASFMFLIILALTVLSISSTAYVLRGRTRMNNPWIFGFRDSYSEKLGLNAQSYYSEFQRVYGYMYVGREFVYRFVVNPLTSWFIRVSEILNKLDTRYYTTSCNFVKDRLTLRILKLVNIYDRFDTYLHIASYIITLFLVVLMLAVLILIIKW